MIADLGIVKSTQSFGTFFFATSESQQVAHDGDHWPTYASTCPVSSQVLDLDEIVLKVTTNRLEPGQKPVCRRLEIRHSCREATTPGFCAASSVETL